MAYKQTLEDNFVYFCVESLNRISTSLRPRESLGDLSLEDKFVCSHGPFSIFFLVELFGRQHNVQPNW